MKRKIFAALLAVMMVVSILPLGVMAAEPSVKPCTHPYYNSYEEYEKGYIAGKPGWYIEAGKEPTCTERGWQQKAFCAACNNTYLLKDGHYEVVVANKQDMQKIYIDALGHNYVNSVCTVCGGVDGHEGHNIANVPGKDATCTVKGLTDGKFCNTCGKFAVSQKDIPVTAHNFEDDYCSVCGAYEHEGHAVVDVAGKDATCTDKGLTAGTFCNTCGKFVESQKDIPATGHNFEDDYCSVCGAYEHEGHAVVDVAGKDATCTDKGLTAGTFCMDCGKFVESQKDIPATGHNFEDDYCSVCGAYEHEGHAVVDVAGKDATCTDKGLTAGTFCMDCGKFVESQKDIPALGHDMVEIKREEANCLYPAYVFYECSRCDYEMGREEGQPSDVHSGGTYTDTFEADCKNAGYIKTYCKTCDELLNEVTLPVTDDHVFLGDTCLVCKKVCDHSATYTFTVEANCSSTGTKQTFCKDCETLVAEETLPQNDSHFFYNGACLLCGEKEECKHDYKVVKREDATCTFPAYVWYECELCGYEKNGEEGIADGEHNYVVVKELPATCTEPAYVWYECSECGAEKNGEVGVADGEHNYVVVKELPATCLEPGYVWKVCSACGAEKNHEVGVADGEHTYVVVKELPATCTEPAYVWYECSACGAEKNGEVGVADGEHNYVIVKELPATCLEPAYVWKVCSVCGAEKNHEVGVADGAHDYVIVRELPATCTEPAYVWKVCSVCGAEKNHEVGEATNMHIVENGVCIVCGREQPVFVCEHKNAAKINSVPADCYYTGVELWQCNDCKATWTVELPTTGIHNYEDGVCSVCGEKEPVVEEPKPEPKFDMPKLNLRSIVIDTTEGGKTGVASGRCYGALGSTYRLAVTPDEGFEVDEVLVNGKAVEAKNGKISFVVKGNTYVEVSFAEIED